MQRLGVISDTHGLLRPEALDALHGVTRIVHAGDIGSAEVLCQLAQIAPVTAVRGNNDTADWAADIPESATIKLPGCSVYVLHDLKLLDIDPARSGTRIVIAGHSHKPQIVDRAGILYFNPGSAGPRRFKLPVSLGFISVDEAQLGAEVLDLLTHTRIAAHDMQLV